MQIVEANKLAEQATNNLITALKAGKSETLIEYFKVLARLHTYSFRNLSLIFAQKPNATRVAGFTAWKNLNRFVKKGEKGIVVIAPIFKKSSDHADEKDEIRFKASYVFDVSQTEGDDLPTLSETTGQPGEYTAKLKALLTSKGIELTYASDLEGADGMSMGGKIVLKNDLPPSVEFSVLVHELGHELMHHQNSEKKIKKVRELEAEAVAFVVSEAIGLKSLDAAKDYIQLYGGSDELLTESLTAIHKASSEILAALLKEAEREAA